MRLENSVLDLSIQSVLFDRGYGNEFLVSCTGIRGHGELYNVTLCADLLFVVERSTKKMNNLWRWRDAVLRRDERPIFSEFSIVPK